MSTAPVTNTQRQEHHRRTTVKLAQLQAQGRRVFAAGSRQGAEPQWGGDPKMGMLAHFHPLEKPQALSPALHLSLEAGCEKQRVLACLSCLPLHGFLLPAMTSFPLQHAGSLQSSSTNHLHQATRSINVGNIRQGSRALRWVLERHGSKNQHATKSSLHRFLVSPELLGATHTEEEPGQGCSQPRC